MTKPQKIQYQLYEVGGKIRDFYLGIESKDVDYSVVLTHPDIFPNATEALHAFSKQLEEEGFEVFLITPETFTIKAKFPKDHKYSGVADFVIARKEVGYVYGTRTPIVQLGSLIDDLERRDFTVNAMAKDDSGLLIDPFGGARDLLDKVLKTPSDSFRSFNEDPLRILRAMRFSVTRGLSFSDQIIHAIMLFDSSKMSVVSEERIRAELHQMFKKDTLQTLDLLRWLYVSNNALYKVILGGDTWLEPTNKQ
jgi:poly(A) polymerase